LKKKQPETLTGELKQLQPLGTTLRSRPSWLAKQLEPSGLAKRLNKAEVTAADVADQIEIETRSYTSGWNGQCLVWMSIMHQHPA
jgi:hypothetical protein